MVSGSASLRRVPVAGVLLLLSAGVVAGAQWLGRPAATVQTSEWYAVLLVALTASAVVHHERTRGLVRLAQAHDDLEQQATVDAPARVHTRYGMTCAYPLVRAQAARAEMPVFALFLDVDGLKRVNDTLGHDAGDLLIRQTADALRHTARSTDVIARWGGDEFIVLGAGTPPPLARMAEAIEAQLRVRWNRPDAAPVTVSLGMAIRTPDRRRPRGAHRPGRRRDARAAAGAAERE